MLPTKTFRYFRHMGKCLISVCVITYDQRDYIAQCLEGILQQRSECDVEIILNDDASSDGTSKICQQYQEQYPDKIKYQRNEQNLGMMGNFINALNRCQGDYIAICEGDDYWMHPEKLQLQCTEFSKDPRMVISFTDRTFLDPSGKDCTPAGKPVKEAYDFIDLVEGNKMSTLTVLIKRANLYPLPSFLEHVVTGDWPLYLWTLRKGGVAKFLDVKTSVHRYDIGVSVGLRKRETKLSEGFLFILDEMSKQVSNKEYLRAISGRYRSILKSVFVKKAKEHDIFKAVGWLLFELRQETFFKRSTRLIGIFINITKTKLGSPVTLEDT